MKYEIDIRDKDGNLYVDSNGVKVVRNDFAFERNVRNENTIKEICEDFALMIEAIAKEGTDITIEVSDFNSISDTWMVLYSYYHTEKRFVKH